MAGRKKFESGSSKVLQNRKRKISDSDGIDTILMPHESKYLLRSMKNDTQTVTAPKRSRKQVLKNAIEEKPADTTIMLTDLPNEILGKITEYLSFDDLFRMERVNKRLRGVVKAYTWPQKHTFNHDAVIRNTDFPKISMAEERSCHRFDPRRVLYRRHNITSKSLKAVFSRAKIRNLDLSIYHSKLTYQISAAFSMVPELRTLNLSFVRLTNNSLRSIARYCPELVKVTFEQCFCDGKVEQGLETLFTKCPNITYLDLAENNKLYGDSFAYIPTGLLYLNLANCYNVNTTAIGALSENAQNLETLIIENYDNAAVSNFNSWLSKLKKLRFLEVSNIFITQDFPFLDFSHFQDLEMLCLRYNSLVNADSLRTLQHCPKLKSVDLRFGNQFDNSALDILKRCKSLQYCNFSNWSQLTDVVDFVKHLKIKYLSINDCRAINAEVVHKVITECDSLRYLEILGLNIDYQEVLPDALKQSCPKRTTLLHLAAPTPNYPMPLSKWCQLIPCQQHSPSPFGRFTSIRAQYQQK